MLASTRCFLVAGIGALAMVLCTQPGGAYASTATDGVASISVPSVVLIRSNGCRSVSYRVRNLSHSEDFGAHVQIFDPRGVLKVGSNFYGDFTKQLRLCRPDDRVGRYRVVMTYGTRLDKDEAVLRTSFVVRLGD